MQHNMRKLVIICTILLVSTLIINPLSLTIADDSKNTIIFKTYSFDQPIITLTNLGHDQLFHKVTLTDTFYVGNEGYPKIPVYTAKILIPPNKDIQKITVQSDEANQIALDYPIEPHLPIQKISSLYESLYPDQYSISFSEVYKQNSLYPNNLFKQVGTHHFRGYTIALFQIYPIRYNSQSQYLTYYESISLTITLQDCEKINKNFRGKDTDVQNVLNKIDNPSFLSSYNSLFSKYQKNNDEDYDLLILTSSELKPSFEPLVAAHTSIKSKIKTIEDISFFPSTISSEKIRSFIKDEYINNGIDYVLLGGDDEIIPIKYLWVQTLPGEEAANLASDLYYSCLDGPFDYDGDGRNGEPTDGEDGGDVDLMAEVYLGRASVNTVEEAENFVSKTVKILENQHALSNKSLFVGELLWTSPNTYGGDYLDELINSSTANQMTTSGIPSDQYDIIKLYDKHLMVNTNSQTKWSKETLIDMLNSENFNWINHMGHSNVGNAMRLFRDDVELLHNENPFFIYSQGCYAGAFSANDSIAEYFTVKTDHAAYATIMNTDYGWGEVGGTDGASQRYQRQFWDAIFGEQISELGKAFVDSREDFIVQIDQEAMRWCYYELTLFGDPTISFILNDNDEPLKPSTPDRTYQGLFGNVLLSTSTTDTNTDQLFYQWDFGDGTLSEWMGPYESGEKVILSKNWSRIGFYRVKVKARDIHRQESDWSENTFVIWLFPKLNAELYNKLSFLL